jgi:hypothetical protein
VERDGLTRLPWETALFRNLRVLEDELDELRRERARLMAANAQLHSQLLKARAWARTSNQNWKLRQQAWRQERTELLQRLEK